FRPEYRAQIGADITQSGTWYYASRFRLNGGDFIYGGLTGLWEAGQSGVLTIPGITFANLQSPASGNAPVGFEEYLVVARLYIDGVTTEITESEYITSWIGYSTENTDPSLWTEDVWYQGEFNSGEAGEFGNDHDYRHNAADANLPIGTYYYASRFQYGDDPFVYGGYSASGGGAWDGSTNVSGTLAVTGFNVPNPPSTVLKNQPFSISITNATASTGLLNESYSTTVEAQPVGGGDLIPVFNSNVNYSSGDASINVTLPQAGTFNLIISITVPPAKAQKNDEILTFTVENVKAEPFTATAGDVQYPAIPFDITIANASDGTGTPLEGNYLVSVTSADGGFANEGQIFSEPVSFSQGAATVSVTLNIEGEHRLVVELVDFLETVIISPDITVVDFSGFQASVDSPGYANLSNDIEITNAFNTTGAFITGSNRVIITSNQETPEVLFDDFVNFSLAGAATIPVILTLGDADPGLEHTLVVAVEGVTDTRLLTLNIIQNQANFSVSFVDESNQLVNELSIVAGVEFRIRVTGVVSPADGTTIISDERTIVVRSQNPDQPESRSFTVTLDANGDSPDLILNPNDGDDATNTFFIAGSHTLEVEIPSLGTMVERPGLTVNPDNVAFLKITQQPENRSGQFNGDPVLLSTVIVKTADKWGNEVPAEADVAVRLVPVEPETTDATLTGSFLWESEEGYIIDDIDTEAVFNDLTLNRNGIFRLEFIDLLEGFPNILSDTFTMSDMENQADFSISNPGPQITGEEFLWDISNAQNYLGTSLNGTFTANLRSLPPNNQIIGSNISFTLENGSGSIPVTIPLTQTASLLDIEITITGIGPSSGDHTENYDGFINSATDGSEFALTDPGVQYAARPFDLEITGARSKDGVLLHTDELDPETLREVTVVTPEDTYVQNLSFTNGTAIFTDLVIGQTGIQQITVSIDWVTNPVSLDITVEDGIEIRDSNGNLVGTGENSFVFETLISGYTQTEADQVAETFTISRVGSGTISNLELTAPSGFTASPLSTTTLDDITPTATFTLTPNTGTTAPGLFDSAVAVSYATGDPKPAVSYEVDFPVADSYQISVSGLFPDIGTISDGQLVEIDLGLDGRIENTGTGTITNLTLSLSGENAGAFTAGFNDGAFTGTLTPESPGNTIEFNITPNGGLASGTYNATVNITADNGIQRQFNIRYTKATTGLDISLSPAGPLFLGVFSEGYNAADATRTITITNTGTDIESFSIALIEGSGFTANPPSGGAIAAGASQDFTITPDAGLLNGNFIEATFTVTVFDNTTPDPLSETDTIVVSFMVDQIAWDGSVNSNWNIGSNWLPATYNGGAWPVNVIPEPPNRFVDVLIPTGKARYPVIASQNIRTSSLTIDNLAALTVQNTGVLTVDPGGSLNINNGGSLTVSNLVTNEGTLAITTGGSLTVSPTGRITSSEGTMSNALENVDNFIIQSSSQGTGSVIVSNSGVYATVERWMKGNQHFHLLSIPVSGQDIAQFLTDNGSTDTVTIAEYNEATHAWGAWGSYTAGNFIAGKSYMLVRVSEGIVNFKGSLLHGNQSYTARRDRFGWNTVGNPYPSGFFVNAFLNANMPQMQDGFKALYIYDFDAQPGDRYKTVNLIDGPRILSNTQGFFIRAGEENFSGSTHPISFNNTMHVHSTGAEYFKSGNEELTDWYKLRLYMQIPGNTASTLVAFNSFMTDSIDEGYDAGVMGITNPFSIYTMAPEFDENLSIIALPDNNFENMLIPLGMTHEGAEPVTLSADTQELPYYLVPLLYDAHKGTFTQITHTGISFHLGSEATAGQYFIRMQDSRNTHSITFAAQEEGGEVTAQANEELLLSGNVLAEGTSILFTAVPFAGFTVDHWLVNGQQMEDNNNSLFLERLLGDTQVYAVFTDSSKGILDTDNLNDNTIKIFTRGDHIVIEGILEENTRAQLFDVSGRKVLEVNLHSGPSNLVHARGLIEGVYILHLVNDRKHETKRLFIR
ncbi:MAG: hypothetical protein ACOCX0_02265, partial [Bacteroidota bacterium]